jgi:hypothetical protein
MAILEKNNFRSNLKPKIQVEEKMLECKAFNAISPKKQHSCSVEGSDGIDQDATFMEDEVEEEENKHERDQEDVQKKEVEEDNGDEELEESGSKGNFTKSPLPKKKQPIKHKVVKTRSKIVGKPKPIHLKVSTRSGCTLVPPSNTPLKAEAP